MNIQSISTYGTNQNKNLSFKQLIINNTAKFPKNVLKEINNSEIKKIADVLDKQNKNLSINYDDAMVHLWVKPKEQQPPPRFLAHYLGSFHENWIEMISSQEVIEQYEKAIKH